MSNRSLSIQDVMLDQLVHEIIQIRTQIWGKPDKKPRKGLYFIICPICAMLTRTAPISTIRGRVFPAPRPASHHSGLLVCDICHTEAENDFFQVGNIPNYVRYIHSLNYV